MLYILYADKDAVFLPEETNGQIDSRWGYIKLWGKTVDVQGVWPSVRQNKG